MANPPVRDVPPGTLCRWVRALAKQFGCGDDQNADLVRPRVVGQAVKPKELYEQVLIHLREKPGVDFGDPAQVLKYLQADEQWRRFDQEFGPLRVFPSLPRDDGASDKLVEMAKANVERYGFRGYNPSFKQYFYVLQPKRKRNAGALRHALARLGAVDHADVIPVTRPADATTQFRDSSGTGLVPPGRGIGASSVLAAAASKLATVRIAAMESEWPGRNAAAEPLNRWNFFPTVPQSPLAGWTGSNVFEDSRHGAQTWGVIAGADPSAGVAVQGIAPGVPFSFCPTIVDIPPDPVLDPTGTLYDRQMEMLHAAILAVVPTLAAGDVLLIERETMQGTPVECYPIIHDAIRTAVASNHLIVVEPAGNGWIDLADPSVVAHVRVGSDYVPRRLDCSVAGLHSGAILVAAGESGEPSATNQSRFGKRIDSSNYGQLIDCWAWGDSIRSYWYDRAGNGAILQSLDVHGYGQTSGAAAIVAGAIVLMQALRKSGTAPGGATFGPLNAAQVRGLLRKFGNPGQDELANVRMPAVDAMQSVLQTSATLPSQATPCDAVIG